MLVIRPGRYQDNADIWLNLNHFPARTTLPLHRMGEARCPIGDAHTSRGKRLRKVQRMSLSPRLAWNRVMGSNKPYIHNESKFLFSNLKRAPISITTRLLMTTRFRAERHF